MERTDGPGLGPGFWTRRDCALRLQFLSVEAASVVVVSWGLGGPGAML